VRFRLGSTAVLLALALPAAAAAAPGPVSFGAPAYVDTQLAGGEPLVWQDPFHHTLLYTSHEGTTHLYRPGLSSPSGSFQFISNYRNQVILWVSKDDGRTWTRVNYMGTGFRTDPSENTGFSDPDFTQDAGGRIYDTGIDLANDALFSSNDGGFSWDRGTIQCTDGDRPWLAGGVKDEVFMASDTLEEGHVIFHSTDGGQTCTRVASDYGDTDNNGAASYYGYGKLFMDHARQRLIEPEIYQDDDGNTVGIGAGTWQRGAGEFTPHFIAKTTLQTHFPSIAIDRDDNVYMTWDTDPRSTTEKNGCGGSASPLANEIKLAVSRDFGQTWSAPITIAAPASARVLWPWAVAGDPGNVSVVWYQADRVGDPDCAPDDVKWSIHAARITGAQDPAAAAISTGSASPVIHEGGICQGGTTCVATGQDRRLGDFFTNGIDARGCEIIASGDTRMTDELGGPLPTARPIFIRQTSGPALSGSGSCGPGTAARGDESYVLGAKQKSAHGKKRKRCASAHRKRKHRRAAHSATTSAKKQHANKHRKRCTGKRKHQRKHRSRR
jgi:hypothetical protein